MRTRSLVILLILVGSVAPAYYINNYLQRIIAPRQSFTRLLLYLLSGFVLVFVYTFLVIWIISRLFPLPLK
jgi:hypothetical protein